MTERDEFAWLDGILERAVDGGQVPGVVAGVADGRGSRVAAAGSLAFGGAPMRRDTLFRISSNTKPITAVAALALVDDGVLDLEAPVDDLLPELADRRVLRNPDGPLDDTVPARRPITVRDLLTFTCGFGLEGAMLTADDPWPIFTAAVERDLHTFGPPQPASMPDAGTWTARLGELPLVAQPGHMWLYNTGTQILVALMSRAVGRPFDEILRERVLAPLGMDNTAFWASDPSRLPTAYLRERGEFTVFDPPDGQWAVEPAFPDGSAGLLSTADDLLAFGRMLMRGGDPVLRPATAAEMIRDQLTPEQYANAWPGFSFLDGRAWGYGVSVLDDGSYMWEGGLGSVWINLPHVDRTVVVLTQASIDEQGLPGVCVEVIEAARSTA
ncbi:beta-lactamase family protein [Glycomyces sp. TRM65418]|uniref:serine hydrolase domain-containing protein n=1 Tax=Glycomyces sp. TRM65418 TaxID=2867006 RepID=UPI001CE512CC|nr:serine hydrolase domain-containing protein [Glycomyces sp. TRM65418]MCC3765170.1 beta-lactamase family protein [Glycomyces sp. TRM65418]QZD54795.1 beta-lactamase family protein [Glycomyces sp. TRM65418]